MFTSVDRTWTRRLLSSLVLALALVACGDDSGDSDDKDDENEEKADTGPKKDGSTNKDGSIDAGDEEEEDASPSSDASKPSDAKVADSGGKDGATGDGGGGDPIPTLNGCAPDDYVDLSAISATRTISFGGGLGNKYDPKCITIAAGQTVKFEGTFNAHPLAKGEPNDEEAGSAENPIPTVDAALKTGTSKTFTFAEAGTYPYHCTVHESMVGSIHVK